MMSGEDGSARRWRCLGGIVACAMIAMVVILFALSVIGRLVGDRAWIRGVPLWFVIAMGLGFAALAIFEWGERRAAAKATNRKGRNDEQ